MVGMKTLVTMKNEDRCTHKHDEDLSDKKKEEEKSSWSL